jgi:hypothetical protein
MGPIAQMDIPGVPAGCHTVGANEPPIVAAQRMPALSQDHSPRRRPPFATKVLAVLSFACEDYA